MNEGTPVCLEESTCRDLGSSIRLMLFIMVETKNHLGKWNCVKTDEMKHFTKSKHSSTEGIAELASWLRVSCCFQRTHPCWYAVMRISAELSLVAMWSNSRGTLFCWGSAQPSPQAATLRPILWSAGAELCRFLMGDVSGWKAKTFLLWGYANQEQRGVVEEKPAGSAGTSRPSHTQSLEEHGGIDGTGCLSKTKVPSLRRR